MIDDGFPGDATQQQIDDQLLSDFRDQVTPGTPAPVTIPQRTAELLLSLVEDSYATGTAPVVTSLSPAYTNTGSQNLSVRGNGFTSGSKIVFDGTEMSNTVFKDAGWLQSMVSAPPGTYDVLVHDAAGDSNAMQFQFR
jgi:IPT/TIG domain